ncbi:hypothetical protein ACFOLF_12275 [Paenibacillus sepulcri]|uniref:Apea-like HEPN domain-containing protein n=1 Tax=Paenibacillus sepulcri TaxID=359917 RepID=A0ABS7BUZ4_9BACL|nr:hypothetical protein [Paenibacillus sepulcri]
MEPMYLRKVSDIGTENPIVARLCVQSIDLMKPFNLDQKLQDDIYNVLGVNVKDRLVACYKSYIYIYNEIIRLDKEISLSKTDKVNPNIVEIPTIIDLNEKCENFLYQSKLALRDLCVLFKIIYNKTFDEPRFDKIYDWAKNEFGENNSLTKMIKSDHDTWIRRVISMRNAVEHRGGHSGDLHITNMELAPDNKFTWPKWRLNDEVNGSVLKDMEIYIYNMLAFCEDLQIVILERISPDSPFTFVEIPEEERDINCPIRLKVSLKPEYFKGISE